VSGGENRENSFTGRDVSTAIGVFPVFPA